MSFVGVWVTGGINHAIQARPNRQLTFAGISTGVIVDGEMDVPLGQHISIDVTQGDAPG